MLPSNSNDPNDNDDDQNRLLNRLVFAPPSPLPQLLDIGEHPALPMPLEGFPENWRRRMERHNQGMQDLIHRVREESRQQDPRNVVAPSAHAEDNSESQVRGFPDVPEAARPPQQQDIPAIPAPEHLEQSDPALPFLPEGFVDHRLHQMELRRQENPEFNERAREEGIQQEAAQPEELAPRSATTSPPGPEEHLDQPDNQILGLLAPDAPRQPEQQDIPPISQPQNLDIGQFGPLAIAIPPEDFPEQWRRPFEHQEMQNIIHNGQGRQEPVPPPRIDAMVSPARGEDHLNQPENQIFGLPDALEAPRQPRQQGTPASLQPQQAGFGQLDSPGLLIPREDFAEHCRRSMELRRLELQELIQGRQQQPPLPEVPAPRNNVVDPPARAQIRGFAIAPDADALRQPQQREIPAPPRPQQRQAEQQHLAPPPYELHQSDTAANRTMTISIENSNNSAEEDSTMTVRFNIPSATSLNVRINNRSAPYRLPRNNADETRANARRAWRNREQSRERNNNPVDDMEPCTCLAYMFLCGYFSEDHEDVYDYLPRD